MCADLNMNYISKDGDIESPVHIDDVPYRGLTPVKIGQLQDTPIPLQLQRRSPREILEQKAKIRTTIPKTQDGIKCSRTATDDGCSIPDTHEEVLAKLHYLNIIDALSKGFSLDDINYFDEVKDSKRLMAEAIMKEDNLKTKASQLEESFWRQQAILEAKIHIHSEDEELCRGQLIRIWSARASIIPRHSTSGRLRKLDSHQMSKLIAMV